MILTKICGLSTPETLDAAIAGGASHVGFVFFAKSPRNISVELASELSGQIPQHIKTVAVLVEPDNQFLDRLLGIVRIDVLQLHGDEPPQRVAELKARYGREMWKAAPVRTVHDVARFHRYGGAADLLLFDAKPPPSSDMMGGSGLRFDWQMLNGYHHAMPWGLAGGLDAGNLAEAVRVTRASLVDVSSGVESAPGVKDVDKIAAFLKAAASL